MPSQTLDTSADDRQPHHVDLHVGARVRVRRKFLGLSQEALANGIGLTFQQVQKYERGANRISASKLFEISTFLKSNISFYFEGINGAAALQAYTESETEAFVHRFLMTTEGIELATAFPRISNPKYRRRVLELVRTLSDEDDEVNQSADD